MTGKKPNPVAGITVYQRGRKWSYRLELDRHPLTGERQFEYQHGFPSDERGMDGRCKGEGSA